uniref:Uncharacterized protein n=1 Tax=Megaselia scalaris TaxID=36166 RepID=T1H566_MEGSC
MRILNSGNIIVSTLPAISTEGLTKDDVQVLIDNVHKQMSAVYKDTSAEVLNKVSLQHKTKEALKSFKKTIPNTTAVEKLSVYNNFKDTVIAQ